MLEYAAGEGFIGGCEVVWGGYRGVTLWGEGGGGGGVCVAGTGSTCARVAGRFGQAVRSCVCVCVCVCLCVYIHIYVLRVALVRLSGLVCVCVCVCVSLYTYI
jgi:hypothetical protein